MGNNHSWFHLAVEDEDNESEDTGDELGGLFHVSRPDKEAKQKANGLDCSKFLVEKPQDWDLEEVIQSDSCICKSCACYVLTVFPKALLSYYGKVSLKQTHVSYSHCTSSAT